MADFFEKLWRCYIKKKHRVKMDSYGYCVRCNKSIYRYYEGWNG